MVDSATNAPSTSPTPIHKTLLLIALALPFTLLAENAAAPAGKPVNTECPISGKPVDPKIAASYEGVTYAFAVEACRTKWEAQRAASLYQQLGGKAAIDAAVDLFYTKVLADDRVKHYFKDINMTRQAKKQKEFLSVALGAPIQYTGADMRTAHRELPGLNDSHFNAIGEHLKATLTELKVKDELIGKVLDVVETTRADVLNRPKASN